MGRKIRNALLGNLWLKLLSLLIAIFIWIMVTNANNPVRTMITSIMKDRLRGPKILSMAFCSLLSSLL